MEFWTSVRVIRRRWYAVVGVLVLALLVGGYLVHSAKPTYLASGTLVFLRKDQPPPPSDPFNPWVSGADAQSSGFATKIGLVLDDSAFRDKVVADGGSSNFTVTPPVSSNSIMGLSVTDRTPAEALKSYQVLVDDLRLEMEKRQDEVKAPTLTRVTAENLNTPSRAIEQVAARTKVIIIVTTMGLFLALGAAFLVDSMMEHRAQRRERDRASISLGPVTLPGEAENSGPPGSARETDSIDVPLKALLEEAEHPSTSQGVNAP